MAPIIEQRSWAFNYNRTVTLNRVFDCWVCLIVDWCCFSSFVCCIFLNESCHLYQFHKTNITYIVCLCFKELNFYFIFLFLFFFSNLIIKPCPMNSSKHPRNCDWLERLCLLSSNFVFSFPLTYSEHRCGNHELNLHFSSGSLVLEDPSLSVFLSDLSWETIVLFLQWRY